MLELSGRKVICRCAAVASRGSTWPGRSSIDHIEVTMHAVGGDYPTWGADFQVDSLGWFDSL